VTREGINELRCGLYLRGDSCNSFDRVGDGEGGERIAVLVYPEEVAVGVGALGPGVSPAGGCGTTSPRGGTSRPEGVGRNRPAAEILFTTRGGSSAVWVAAQIALNMNAFFIGL